MTVESRSSIVDITNLSAAAAQTAIRAEQDVLEAAGFTVTQQEVRHQKAAGVDADLVYLMGILPSHLAQSFEVNESVWVPASDLVVVGGTWTLILDANGVPVKSRAQADGTGTITAPFSLPARSAASRGNKLISVDLSYEIANAAADAVGALTASKLTAVANAVATDGDPILAALTGTVDGAHDTAGERLTIGAHNTRFTVTTPAYLAAERVHYQADMTFDAAATTDLTVYGARIAYATTR